MVLKPNAVVDIAKQGPQLQNLTGMWNARVLDGFTPFVVQFKENGLPVNLTDLNAFIEGDIGEGHYDSATDDIVMTGTPKSVRYTDDGSGNTNLGIVVFRLPPQFFIQTGIFKGFIGLQSSTGIRSTSNDVWFKVLGNSYTMGISCKYFISDFQKALDQADGKITQALNDLYNKYNQKAGQAESNLDNVLATIKEIQATQQNLNNRLDGIKNQIDDNDVIRKVEFNQLSNQLTQQVSQMRESGLEFFDNEDKLKSTYPDGANKLCVALNNSHQYIYDYVNKQWNDAGAFNYGTIDPKLTQNIYSNNSDNLILNSDFHGLDMWTPGRDATTPNVYVDTSDAINNSNVAVMNGYIKDGSSNWSYLVSQIFPANAAKHPNISISADISLQDINTEAGDIACIELDMFDVNNQKTVWTKELTNNFDFQRIEWSNLVLPPNTVNCYIAFTMQGLGQFKIRRPQVNYGSNTIPYSKAEFFNSNLLANNPIVDWNYPIDNNHYLIDKSITYNGCPTLHIKNNSVENYYFPTSPLIKVDKNSMISLAVPFQGTRDINSRVYLEIHQYNDFNSSENSETRYISQQLNPGSKLKVELFNNIRLANTTQYIDVRFVTYGKVDINVGNISLYENKYVPETINYTNDYLSSKNQFLFHPITNWDVSSISSSDITADNLLLDTQGHPTIQIKTPTDRALGQTFSIACANNSSTIRVNSRRFSFRFEYRQNVDFKKGYVEVIIRQYANNLEKFNINKQINFLLPNSNDLREIEFDNILLNSDTKYIDVWIYGEGCVDANFSNFEQIPNPKLTNNLIYQLNPSNWYANIVNPNLVTLNRTDDSISLSSKDADDHYLTLSSTPFQVEPNSNYTISILSSTNYDAANNEVYLEIEKGTTPDEASGYNVLTLLRFDQKAKNKNNIFKFTTDKNTRYVNFKLVIHRSAQAEFGIINLYKGDLQDTNSHILPQLNIMSDDPITDKWQGSQFSYKDGERQVTGYLQYAIQGDSSRNYPKKNLKLKFFKDADFKEKMSWKPKSDWDKNNKFNLKANWIDATQSRNLVNSKLFAKATAITPFNFSNQSGLLNSQNLGQMEGFPIELYFNSNYYGLMTFNTKKDNKPYGLDSDNPANEAIEVENSASGLSDKDEQLDGTNYATIVQDNPSDELKTNFHNLVNFINTSTDDDFKAKIGTYIDINSVFNCILWGLYSSMYDFVKKSMILLTWDSGKTFYLTLYDMDSTWGLFWDGSKLITEDVFNFSKPDKVLVSWNNNFYKRIYKLFKPEVQKQYKYLRANVWRNDQVVNAYKQYIHSIPEQAYEREQEKWQDIPSKKITNFAQIQQ